jgi:hypothetical protein
VTGQIAWRGRPCGVSAKVVIGAPGSDDAIVLLSAQDGLRETLLRYRADGSVVWRAELPTHWSADYYVDVDLVEDVIHAGSWSGFDVVIDPATGRILSKQFTK